MKSQLSLGTILMFIWAIGQTALATTIIPPVNLGEMANYSGAVVLAKAVRNYELDMNGAIRYRTQFSLIDRVKGEIEEVFDVQNMHLKIGDLERTIDGDINFEEGEKYLLFLEQSPYGYWQTRMLSYAVFNEKEKDGELVLVPVLGGLNFNVYSRPDGQTVEPMEVYFAKSLRSHLKDVVAGHVNWQRKKVAAPYEMSAFQSSDFRTPPSHCNPLGDPPPPPPWPRWQGFENNTLLPVFYHEDGDAGCANAKGKIQGAVANLNTNYIYINLSVGGDHTYVPSDCSGGAYGTEFINWVFNNLGTDRAILVQFNDPCSQIPDLNSCVGVLAMGGTYSYSTTHTHDGMEWENAAYGFVVTNNSTGSCLCSMGSDYDLMINHELTHSLGIGHITSGTANMNPSCCNTIQTLDQECLDYTYNLLLPVELISFTVEMAGQEVQLKWSTASEINNDYFSVERSLDGRNFQPLDKIIGAGNSSNKLDYHFQDVEPRLGNNYYRLTQYDFDGNFEHSKVVFVNYKIGHEQISLFPNPVNGSAANLKISSLEEKEFIIEVFNARGVVVESVKKMVDKGVSIHPLITTSFSSGVYWVRVSANGRAWVEKMVLM